jgi:uncharacterized protein involved in exopolysaccharide biosynthesis
MTIESASAEDLRMDVAALLGALWARALRIVIVTVLLLVATYLVLMFVPKQYESVAGLLVEDRSNTYTQAATQTSGTTNSGISIDALLSSQIELIKSRDALLAVADQLNLRSLPEFNGAGGTSPLTMVLGLIGKKPEPKSVDETVLATLSDRLTVVRELDSAVISIHVRSYDPELAAKIANAIAAEHVKRRAQQSLTDTRDATVWLQQQIDQLRVKVQAADSKVADFKSQNSIFAGSNGTTLPDQQISDIGKQITDAQAAKNSAQQRGDLIRSLLKSGASVESADDVRNSAVVQSLMQQRATLQSTLAEKSALLLPAHPTIKALNAQITQTNAQIRAEAKRIADGLAAQVDVQNGIISSLNDDLKRAQLAASTQTKDGVTLDSLTREAKAQRDLLDSYLLKYRDASSRTDSGAVLPDVRVVTQAAPSAVPASPKTTLILGAVGFVALALQIGTVLFGELMSGRAVYDRNARLQEPAFGDDVDGAAPAGGIADDEHAEHPAQVDAEFDPDPGDLPEPDIVAAAAETPSAGVMVTEPAPVAAPVWTVEPVAAAPRHRAAAENALELSNLSADLTLGRVRIVLLAAVSEARDAAIVADMLAGDALQAGLSVCRVDAGSARQSAEPGISDLCAEQVSFGDVVHRLRDGLAEVPWGHLATIDRRSPRAMTLVEALADIYEVVIVLTGRVGLNSNLPLFEGTPGRLVLVRGASTPPALVESVSADAAALGFEVARSVAVPEAQSEVA